MQQKYLLWTSRLYYVQTKFRLVYLFHILNYTLALYTFIVYAWAKREQFCAIVILMWIWFDFNLTHFFAAYT